MGMASDLLERLSEDPRSSPSTPAPTWTSSAPFFAIWRGKGRGHHPPPRPLHRGPPRAPGPKRPRLPGPGPPRPGPLPLSPTLEGLPLTGPTRAPLEHLLRRHRPDRLLLAFYGQGLGRGFPGGKETEAGWRPLEAEGAPLHLRVRSPTGLLYPERRAYPAWESPPLPVDLPETEGPYLGG